MNILRVLEEGLERLRVSEARFKQESDYAGLAQDEFEYLARVKEIEAKSKDEAVIRDEPETPSYPQNLAA